ncbi:MAG: alpha/beta hydrolase [Planctomycetota bacterium]|nr:MAG: alpha/beta hydrolase [Planctomycetota bacterium]
MRLTTSPAALIAAALLAAPAAPAQDGAEIDNFVHPPGTATAPLGELGHVEVMGDGPLDLVLIPGAAFDWTVWRTFMERNRGRYTMHAITPAGYGGTNPPPMPEANDRFEHREWTEALLGAVAQYVREQELDRPIVVGHHLMGDYCAMRLALDHPDLFRGVVVIAGSPMRFLPSPDSPGRPATLEERVEVVHTNSSQAPFYRRVSFERWKRGTYKAQMFCADEERGRALFEQQLAVPLPTQIRYFLEYLTDDVSVRLSGLEVPMLAVHPAPRSPFFTKNNEFDFDAFIESNIDAYLAAQADPPSREEAAERMRESILKQFGSVDALAQTVRSRNPWSSIAGTNPMLSVIEIAGSGIFVMEDAPQRLDDILAGFSAGLARAE